MKFKKLLDILKTYTNVCDNLNPHYCVFPDYYLWTMRHNGFIPWDDIDVVMPRRDYDIYTKEAINYLGFKAICFICIINVF